MLEFACLPFVLATAPKVFTKLMKPVVAMLRQRGVRLIIYIHDILIIAESLELLAGSFAIKTFCKNKAVAHVKLLMDNTSAVAYISKMGGTHSQTLANLALLQKWGPLDVDLFASRLTCH